MGLINQGSNNGGLAIAVPARYTDVLYNNYEYLFNKTDKLGAGFVRDNFKAMSILSPTISDYNASWTINGYTYRFFKTKKFTRTSLTTGITEDLPTTGLVLDGTSFFMFPSTAVFYKNKLLFIPGNSVSGQTLTKVYLFDTETLTWALETSMPSGGDRFNVGMIGDKLYIAGGRGPTLTNIKTVRVYDFITKQWSVLPDMTNFLDNGTVVGYNGNIYVISGTNSVNMYDSNTNTWSNKNGMMAMSGVNYTSVFTGDKYYMISGNPYLYEYNFVTDAWTEVKLDMYLPQYSPLIYKDNILTSYIFSTTNIYSVDIDITTNKIVSSKICAGVPSSLVSLYSEYEQLLIDQDESKLYYIDTSIENVGRNIERFNLYEVDYKTKQLTTHPLSLAFKNSFTFYKDGYVYIFTNKAYSTPFNDTPYDTSNGIYRCNVKTREIERFEVEDVKNISGTILNSYLIVGDLLYISYTGNIAVINLNTFEVKFVTSTYSITGLSHDIITDTVYAKSGSSLIKINKEFKSEVILSSIKLTPIVLANATKYFVISDYLIIISDFSMYTIKINTIPTDTSNAVFDSSYGDYIHGMKSPMHTITDVSTPTVDGMKTKPLFDKIILTSNKIQEVKLILGSVFAVDKDNNVIGRFSADKNPVEITLLNGYRIIPASIGRITILGQ